MTICIPSAIGVFGMDNQPPNWLGGALPGPVNTTLDDPRWNGATTQGFGSGINEEAQFRAVYHTDGGQTSLFLSWRVEYDGSIDTLVDGLFVGFMTGASPNPLVLKIEAYSSAAADLSNAAAASIQAFRVTDASGSGTALGSTPTWVTANTRVWFTKSPVTWAIQMRVPLNSAAADITDNLGLKLSDPFRLWYAVHVVTPTRLGGGSVVGGIVEHAWPTGAGVSSDMIGNDIYPHPAATAWEPYHLSTGAGDPMCAGVGGISLDIFNVGTTNAPSSKVAYRTTSPFPVNTFFARPLNGMSTSIAVGQLNARFRLANWGSMIGVGGTWSDIPGGKPSNTMAIPAGALADPGAINFNWTLNAADIAPYLVGKPSDQCLLVELSGAGLTFTNSSVRRNMDIVPASLFSREAEINIEGLTHLPGTSSGDKRAVYLAVETRNMPAVVTPDAPGTVGSTGRGKIPDGALAERRGALLAGVMRGEGEVKQLEQLMPTYRVHVYHDTGRSRVINGTRYPILEAQSGFGYYVEHQGPLYGWTHEIQGAEKIAENFYRLHVPQDGFVKVRTVIEALEQPGGGNDESWLCRLWHAFVSWLKHRFGSP